MGRGYLGGEVLLVEGQNGRGRLVYHQRSEKRVSTYLDELLVGDVATAALVDLTKGHLHGVRAPS